MAAADLGVGMGLMVLLALIPGVHIALVLGLAQGILPPDALMLMYGSFSALLIIQTVVYAYMPGDAGLALPLVHRFMNEGRLREYVMCWLGAGFIGIIAALALPVGTVSFVVQAFKPFAFYLVLLVLFLNLAANRRIGWVLGLLASGIIGYAAITLRVSNPFLAVFTGLFALPFLEGALKGGIGKQKAESARMPDAKEMLKGAVLGSLLALVSFGIPAVGAPSAMGAFAYPMLNDISMLSFFSSFSTSQYFMSFEGLEAGAPRVSATIQMGDAVKGNWIYFVLGYGFGAIVAAAAAEPIYRTMGRGRLGYAIAALAISVSVLLLSGIAGFALMLASYVVGKRFYNEKTALLGSVIIPYLVFSV
jgi:hypothetical protein